MVSYQDIVRSMPEFIGDKRYCNVCGYRFAKFRTFNPLFPREAQCPLCGSLERHRHLYVHLLSIFPTLANKKVLHFAPEPIIKNFFINSPAKYYDADLEPGRASYTADITDIKIEEGFFDYIVCVHVLEHIPDDIKAMQELYKVLKSGGTAFLSVPMCEEHREDLTITDPKERERLYHQCDHVRYYSLEVFLSRLKSVGFDVSFVSKPSAFPPSMDSALLGDNIVLARK